MQFLLKANGRPVLALHSGGFESRLCIQLWNKLLLGGGRTAAQTHCCTNPLLRPVNQARGKSVWSWFKQILETFSYIFTKNWASGKKLWLFTKFPIPGFFLTAVSHKDTDNMVLITCFSSKTSSALHLFSVLAEPDPSVCFLVCKMKIMTLLCSAQLSWGIWICIKRW